MHACGDAALKERSKINNSLSLRRKGVPASDFFIALSCIYLNVIYRVVTYAGVLSGTYNPKIVISFLGAVGCGRARRVHLSHSRVVNWWNLLSIGECLFLIGRFGCWLLPIG